MINCEECYKEVSPKAKTCPHCGHPLLYEWDPVKGIFSVIAWIIGGSGFLFFLILLPATAIFGEQGVLIAIFGIFLVIIWITWQVFSESSDSLFSSSPSLPKLQGGEDFQFKSSFDLLEGFKENPTSQMYTDLTVAINLYTKKYPKFTSTVTEEDFKNYINWAIQETDNVFKDEPQKSKIQKESLTKLLNKLNKKITTTNE